MTKAYGYSSSLAPFIEGLIDQKRSDGFSYEFEAYILSGFDQFCMDSGYSGTIMTRELVMAWAKQRPTESLGYRSHRISFVRQLSLYMTSLGIASYVPRNFSSKEVHVPHVLSKAELKSLFDVVDSHHTKGSRLPYDDLEYRVLLRLYYCCGLRLAEGVNLTKEDVDLESGRMAILQSKGRKDRVVYMADDLAALCRDYAEVMRGYVPDTRWLFPGHNPDVPKPKTSVCGRFKYYWNLTPYAATCDRAPTPHSLRHTFVVDKMNEWMAEGRDLNVMIPYLSKYLGHSSPTGTFYYYHQVSEAFKIIREKDRTSSLVIPEAVAYER